MDIREAWDKSSSLWRHAMNLFLIEVEVSFSIEGSNPSMVLELSG
jgi:hypothetical protein